jgi:hypothetical protein
MKRKPQDRVRRIPDNQLQRGPLRHDALSPELLARLETIWSTIGKYFGGTQEEFEADFCRDQHPQREVAIWWSLTEAWKEYHAIHAPELGTEQEEQALVGTLLALSMGVQEKLPVPPDVVAKLTLALAKVRARRTQT